MTRLHVRTLGDIAVSGAGTRPLSGPTQRRVFAVLVARRNETVSVDQLIDVCWPGGDAPGRAEHNVRTYVHRLRTALGDHDDRIETSAGGYRLGLTGDELDIERFEQIAAEAERLVGTGDLTAALDRFDEADALWRGEPYAEFSHEHWAQAEVARAHETRVAMSERRAETLLGLGRAADAVVVLEQLVRMEPYRETPRSLLMRSLYESGRQAEALRAFHDFRRFLIEDAGVEPSPDLVRLDREIATNQLESSTLRTRRVGNYELHERIGEGAFAVVHRATQASLGRDVAVKVIRAELANRPEFIRRFEAEAQMVASIEHPNVVPLYDYWREPGHAYLVMRWMTGGSLERRLDGGPLAIDEVAALVDQIAAGLDLAHARDIVHRDVKPANILYDDAGRAHLGDFGIALAADERSTPQAALSEGSPIFASPEQLRREPAGPEADIHALAIVAFTALTGRTPFHDAVDEAELLRRQLTEPLPPVSTIRSDVPVAVDDVIATATAKRASDRYPTAGGFAAAFRAATGDERAAPVITLLDRSNPYLGLRAFTEVDAGMFHGRARLVDELVAACSDPDHRLLAVVGPSGSGKSSVVRAGLVPALRSGRLPGSGNWFVTTMLPGAHPFEALETALLRVATNPPASLLDQLCEGDRGIHRGASRIVSDAADTVLVVIDQFEELFTATGSEERQRFLRALAVAATEPDGPVRIVATMRADFYDQPLRHPEFAPLFKRSTVAVTPLAPDELEEAITAPAAAVGVDFEPGLVAELVADVNSQPGALPLLQYALTQTFDASEGGALTTSTYRDIGGLTGALARRAETLYTESAEADHVAARRLFGRLVTLGEGTEDTRRRVRRSELPGDEATDRMIERFGGARLLTFDHDPATREPTIEIAHEALIREWPRLRRWLDEDRAALRTHRHLTAAATAWVERDRDPNELYRGARLDAAEDLLEAPGIALNVTESEFLTAGVEQRERAAAAERSRVRRLRRLVGATAVIAALALIAGAVAAWQWSRADEAATAAARSAEQADLERIQAIARTADRSDPTIGILLAIEAYRSEPSVDSLDVLHRALTARPAFEGTLASDPIGSITALDDGERIVTHTASSIDIWDVAQRRREVSWPFPGSDGSGPLTLTAEPTGDGSLIIAGAGTTTTVIESATGTVRWALEHPGDVTAVSVDASGALVAVGVGRTTAPVVEVWDLTADAVEPAMTFPQPFDVSDIEFHPDGRSIAVGTTDGSTTMWSIDSGELLWEIEIGAPPTTANASRALLYSSDGSRLAFSAESSSQAREDGRASGGNRVVRLVDSATGRDLVDPVEIGDAIGAMAWTTPRERAVYIVPTGTGPISRVEFEAPDSTVDLATPKTQAGDGIAVLDRLGLIAVAGAGGIEIRSIDGTGPLSTRVPLSEDQLAVLRPDGFLVAAFDASSDRFATSALVPGFHPHLVDIGRPGVPPQPWPMPAPFVVGSYAGVATSHSETTGNVIRAGLDGEPFGPVIRYPDAQLASVSLSPDGTRFITIDADERAILWDTSTGEPIAQLDTPETLPGLYAVAEFSPDGKTVSLFSFAGEVRAYGAEDGSPLWSSDDLAVAFPGIGTDDLVATVDDLSDPTVELRDPVTLDPIGAPLVGHQTGISWMAAHAAHQLVATQGRDETTRIWDVESRKQLGRELPMDQPGRIVWSANGRLIAVPTSSGYEIWNYDTSTWPRIGCEVAGRNLTRAEWEQFGPRNAEYRATCEQYPVEP